MNCIPVFDAHCDTIFRMLKTGESLAVNKGMVSLEKTKGSFGRYCQFFALFADCGRPGHATYDELLSCFQRQMTNHCDFIQHCRNAGEAECANKQGRAAAFLSVEGAELLDCDLVRLEQAASDGVISINLTWNHANAISGSSREEPERGLSTLGRRFVSKMEELGVLVDVSHLSDAGFWDVAEMATKPFIASHSNARSIHHHARNLTDAQITAIITNHGIIGLNFYRDFIGGTLDFDGVYAHLDHILTLGGEKAVALGGDWDGCDTIDALPDITALVDLYDYLLTRRISERLLHDFYFKNLMRVVRER